MKPQRHIRKESPSTRTVRMAPSCVYFITIWLTKSLIWKVSDPFLVYGVSNFIGNISNMEFTDIRSSFQCKINWGIRIAPNVGAYLTGQNDVKIDDFGDWLWVKKNASTWFSCGRPTACPLSQPLRLFSAPPSFLCPLLRPSKVFQSSLSFIKPSEIFLRPSQAFCNLFRWQRCMNE